MMARSQAAYHRLRRQTHKRDYRERDLVRRFGIDLAVYQRMFVEQKGVCAICGNPETETRNGQVKWLAVDHDHETGAVRGLLCAACNKGIGWFGESVERLSRAIDYVQRHNKPATVRVVRLVQETA
jgi:hypothetical protein